MVGPVATVMLVFVNCLSTLVIVAPSSLCLQALTGLARAAAPPAPAATVVAATAAVVVAATVAVAAVAMAGTTATMRVPPVATALPVATAPPLVAAMAATAHLATMPAVATAPLPGAATARPPAAATAAVATAVVATVAAATGVVPVATAAAVAATVAAAVPPGAYCACTHVEGGWARAQPAAFSQHRHPTLAHLLLRVTPIPFLALPPSLPPPCCAGLPPLSARATGTARIATPTTLPAAASASSAAPPVATKRPRAERPRLWRSTWPASMGRHCIRSAARKVSISPQCVTLSDSTSLSLLSRPAAARGQ